MDFDARANNLTPFEVRCVPMDDRHGRAVVVAIAKITYDIGRGGSVRLSNSPSPIRFGDEPFDDDASLDGAASGPKPRGSEDPFGSVKYPSDWVDDKPGTDVIVVGTAIPPRGQRVTEMDVSVRVGTLFKAVRVRGPSVYQSSVFGALAPGAAGELSPTPIRYELAFGGIDDGDPDAIVMEPRNPAGTGFAELRHKRVGAAAHRLVLPPSLAEPGREPAGFGVIGAHWSPRIELAGTRDDAWRRTRAPIPPADFDPLHNAVAHPDLHAWAPLRPDAPIELVGLTEEQVLRFRLPDIEARFESQLDDTLREHPTHLDTMILDAEARRAELVFRVAIPLPRKAQRLSRITIRASAEIPASLSPEAAA
jgi:hypothetical protein